MLLLLLVLVAVYDFRRLGKMFLTMVNEGRRYGYTLGGLLRCASAVLRWLWQAKQQTGHQGRELVLDLCSADHLHSFPGQELR